VQDRLEAILAALHAAVPDDAHWIAASGLIDEVCGAKGNHPVFSNDLWDNEISVPLMRLCYEGSTPH